MLYVFAYVNEREIDTIFIGNTLKQNKKGEYQYAVWDKTCYHPDRYPDKKYVWHRRDDGWRKLAVKAIKALEKK